MDHGFGAIPVWGDHSARHAGEDGHGALLSREDHVAVTIHADHGAKHLLEDRLSPEVNSPLTDC